MRLDDSEFKINICTELYCFCVKIFITKCWYAASFNAMKLYNWIVKMLIFFTNEMQYGCGIEDTVKLYVM